MSPPNVLNFDIAHAGGIINGHRYSNSLEAIRNSLANGYRNIELDVLRIKDGFAIAHDGMEKSYGITNFLDIDASTFINLKIYGRYTPPSFTNIAEIINEYPSIYFVFDTKFIDINTFTEFIKFLREKELSGSTILQVYKLEEARAAREIGFARVIFALWKNYAIDSLSESALRELKSINQLGFGQVEVSLSYSKYRAPDENYLDDPRFKELRLIGNNILFHNFPSDAVDKLKSAGFRLFLS